MTKVAQVHQDSHTLEKILEAENASAMAVEKVKLSEEKNWKTKQDALEKIEIEEELKRREATKKEINAAAQKEQARYELEQEAVKAESKKLREAHKTPDQKILQEAATFLLEKMKTV